MDRLPIERVANKGRGTWVFKGEEMGGGERVGLGMKIVGD